jgi:nucleoside 2-deoxyribosyltransferase
MDEDAFQVIKEKGAWMGDFQALQTKACGIVGFTYLHDMAVPSISGIQENPHPPLQVTEEKVVRFGMLEGDAVVNAEWAVYDPQNGNNGRPFGENGSTAEHLALILNAHEARQMTGMIGEHPSAIAPVLAEQQKAEVVVVKMGAEGAFVWTAAQTAQVSAYRTSRVWKIGSGDCFVAHFANAWMHDGKTPTEAAMIASKATAYYCDTRGFPTLDDLEKLNLPLVEFSSAYQLGKRPQVYLAGPFFDLAQVWLVEQARANLQDMGLRVFSPHHDIGLGSAEDVVVKDIEAIQESDLILAITDGLDPGTIYEIGFARAINKPVIIYSERHYGESLKMMEGSGCTICLDYTSALYSTLWEAAKI